MIKKRDREAIENICRLIVRNLEQHYTIAELARREGINERVLKTTFRARYGMGVYAYLKQERMNKAKEQLEITDQSIWKIARMVGFKSISSFSNAFRKQFKLSPTDWRKKLLTYGHSNGLMKAG